MKGWDNCPRCGGSGFAGGILLCNEQPPPIKRRYIAEHWASFERMCIPANAPDEQLDCMRDAFWAGAWALFSTLQSEVSAQSDVTPEDEQVMVCLDRELEEHRARLHARARRRRAKREGRE